jgi:hypothetical protein
MNKKKIIVVEADKVDKFSFVCWKKEPRVNKRNWVQIGPVNGLLGSLDNKLGLIMFPMDLFEEFKEFRSGEVVVTYPYGFQEVLKVSI